MRTNFEKQIEALDAVITAAMSRTDKKSAWQLPSDEWNIWFRSWFHRGNNHMLEEVYNLRDALWVASGLNAFHRNCRTVKLADVAQLVNVIAPIMSQSDRNCTADDILPVEAIHRALRDRGARCAGALGYFSRSAGSPRIWMFQRRRMKEIKN